MRIEELENVKIGISHEEGWKKSRKAAGVSVKSKVLEIL